jgi:hypothetical protein
MASLALLEQSVDKFKTRIRQYLPLEPSKFWMAAKKIDNPSSSAQHETAPPKVLIGWVKRPD